MKDDKMEKPPWTGLVIVGVLVGIALILIIASLVQGAGAFISDGGGTWIIVVVLLLLLVYAMYRGIKQ